jgi:hypothetical protein
MGGPDGNITITGRAGSEEAHAHKDVKGQFWIEADPGESLSITHDGKTQSGLTGFVVHKGDTFTVFDSNKNETRSYMYDGNYKYHSIGKSGPNSSEGEGEGGGGMDGGNAEPDFTPDPNADIDWVGMAIPDLFDKVIDLSGGGGLDDDTGAGDTPLTLDDIIATGTIPPIMGDPTDPGNGTGGIDGGFSTPYIPPLYVDEERNTLPEWVEIYHNFSASSAQDMTASTVAAVNASAIAAVDFNWF